MSKKTTHKKRKSTTRKQTKNTSIYLFILIFLLALISSITAYFLILKSDDNQNSNQVVLEKDLQKDKEQTLEEILNEYKNSVKPRTIDKYEEFNEALEKEYIPETLLNEDNVSKKVNDDNLLGFKKAIEEVITGNSVQTSTAQEIINNKKIKEIENKQNLKSKEKTLQESDKPMLAIIIDDVTLQSQINKIKDIGYVVNIAFMPPTSGHQDSAKIAQNYPHAIVHFPLQAGVSHFEEENTLKVGDSYEKIEKHVAWVREVYPNATFTNNHTGSVFTAHKESMDYFIKALKKHNFQFLDSRTTAKSVAKEITQKYDMPYIARNIFLDNKKDFNYIQNQLKKAIKIAHDTGHSIAIGHPYPITYKVLKESKHLLEGIELVYIDKIPLKHISKN